MATRNLTGQTLAELFLNRVEAAANQRVYLVKENGSFRPQTWKQLYETTLGLYSSLRRKGIQKGDRVAILSNSRPEWSACDLTIQTLGAVTVPVYQSSTVEDIAYILKHSDAKLVFAEDLAQGEKLKAVFEQMGKTLPVVFFKPTPETTFPSETFACFSSPPPDPQAVAEQQRASTRALRPQDLASIVYTSGTTGTPKGALLLHSCLTTEITSIADEIELSPSDTMLTFLPFAHVLGRVESLIPLVSGLTLAFAESVAAVTQNIQEVKPTILISVPRIYEKIHAKILSEVDSWGFYKKQLFHWAIQVGRQTARLRADKKPIPILLQAQFSLADKMVLSKIREKLGGRLRFTVSGGAPLSPELCEFFHACGIKILEGYGLTETCAAIAVNRPNDYRFSSVGKPLAATLFRIADDGEIQVKGPAVFAGYHNDASSTKEAFSPDGWFNTGDIGTIDSNGFLKITDRKKELIVTSGGKNVAPQKLENLIKAIPLVSQALVFGDKEKYLVALITLSAPEAIRWAKEKGVVFKNSAELSGAPEMRAYIEAGLKAINRDLASYETIKKFKILPDDFSLEAGEITPSLKLKRKVICNKYKNEIRALY